MLLPAPLLPHRSAAPSGPATPAACSTASHAAPGMGREHERRSTSLRAIISRGWPGSDAVDGEAVPAARADAAIVASASPCSAQAGRDRER